VKPNEKKIASPTPINKKKAKTPTKSKLTKKQQLRSNVIAVIWILRIKLILAKAKKKLSTESLKYFAKNYENIDTAFKAYVYGAMKKAYHSIVSNDLLKVDFTEKIGPLTKNKEEVIKQKYENVNVITINLHLRAA
jgi:hypothetical protein